jgi:hypothetical protein
VENHLTQNLTLETWIEKKGTAMSFSSIAFHVNLLNLLFDLCSFADSVAEVIKLCSANITAANNLYILHIGRMNRENSFYANAVGNASDGKCFRNAAAFACNYSAFKSLNSFMVTLTDVYIDTNGVTDGKRGQFFFLRNPARLF